MCGGDEQSVGNLDAKLCGIDNGIIWWKRDNLNRMEGNWEELNSDFLNICNHTLGDKAFLCQRKYERSESEIGKVQVECTRRIQHVKKFYQRIYCTENWSSKIIKEAIHSRNLIVQHIYNYLDSSDRRGEEWPAVGASLSDVCVSVTHSWQSSMSQCYHCHVSSSKGRDTLGNFVAHNSCRQQTTQCVRQQITQCVVRILFRATSGTPLMLRGN